MGVFFVCSDYRYLLYPNRDTMCTIKDMLKEIKGQEPKNLLEAVKRCVAAFAFAIDALHESNHNRLVLSMSAVYLMYNSNI